MSMIDFRAVRQQIGILRVLTLLGIRWPRKSGRYNVGWCPLGCCSSPRAASYLIERNYWRCYRCQQKGNALELYGFIRGLDVYKAALELCEKTGVDVPYLQPPSHRTPGTPYWTDGRDE